MSSRGLVPLAAAAATCSGAALAFYNYAMHDDEDSDANLRALRRTEASTSSSSSSSWLPALAGIASACVGAVSARASVLERDENTPRRSAVAAAMWSVVASLLDAEPDARLRLPGGGYAALAKIAATTGNDNDNGNNTSGIGATRAMSALLRGSAERRREWLAVDGVGETLLHCTVPNDEKRSVHLENARNALRRALLGLDTEEDSATTWWRRLATDSVSIRNSKKQQHSIVDTIVQRLEGEQTCTEDDAAAAAVAAWLILAWSRRRFISEKMDTTEHKDNTSDISNAHIAFVTSESLARHLSREISAPEPLRECANRVSRALVARMRCLVEPSRPSGQQQQLVPGGGHAELILLSAAAIVQHVTDERVAVDMLKEATLLAGAAAAAGDNFVMESAFTLITRAAAVASGGQMRVLTELSNTILPRIETLSTASHRSFFECVAACANAAHRCRSEPSMSSLFSTKGAGAEEWAVVLAKATSRCPDEGARHAASVALRKVVDAAGDDGPRVLAVWVRDTINAIVHESAAANKARDDVGEERQQIEGVVLAAVKKMEEQVLTSQTRSTQAPLSPVAAIGGVGAILPLTSPLSTSAATGNHEATVDVDDDELDEPRNTESESASTRTLESRGTGSSSSNSGNVHMDHGRAIARALRPLSVLISSDANLQRVLVGSMELLPLLQALVSYKWPSLDEELAMHRVVARLLAIIAVRQSGARSLDITHDQHGAMASTDASGAQLDSNWDWHDWLERTATSSRDRKLRSHARRALLNTEAVMANARGVGQQQRFAVYQDGVHLIEPNDTRHRLLPLGKRARDDETRTANTDANTPPMFDIVFVHGLLGRPYQSWRIDKGSGTESVEGAITDGQVAHAGGSGQDDANGAGAGEATSEIPIGRAEKILQEKYWPAEWLESDVPNARMLSVAYKTNFSQWEGPSHDLTVLSKTLLPALRAAGVGDRPVVFVTHSMGGLLVKQMLCDASDERISSVMDVTATGTTAITTASNKVSVRSIPGMTKGIMFYSCPHFGSPLLNYLIPGVHQVMLPSAQLLDLRYESPHLSLLNAKLSRLCRGFNIAIMSLAEGSLTPLTEVWEDSGVNISVDIVPPESSYPGFGDFHQLKGITHVNTCKPTSKETDAYILLIQLLKKSGVI